MAGEPGSFDQHVRCILETFGPRGLNLVDSSVDAAGSWLVRFDLSGYRFHLSVSPEPGRGAVLEMRDVVIVDEQRHPGMTNAVGSIGNAVQQRIPHLRVLYAAVGPDSYDRGSDDALPYPHDLLVSLQYGSPVLSGDDERLPAFCELGIDTLFYACGVIHDGIAELGFPSAGPILLD